MERLVAWLLELSSGTIYAVIGGTTLLENVFPPTPSDLAVALGGFLTQHGRVTAVAIWAIACTANLAGTVVVYLLSRKYQKPFRRSRLGRQLLPADAIVALEREYLRFGIAGLFLGRLLPGFRAVVAPFAGLVNLPVASALIPITAATLVWYGFLVWVGTRLGAQWESISHFLGQLNRTLAIVAGIFAVVVAIVIWRKRRARPPRRDRLLRAIHRALGDTGEEAPAVEGPDPAASAAATLLYELARADRGISREERDLIAAHLRDCWRLEEVDAAPSQPAPLQTAEMATLVSDRFSRDQRLALMGRLYQITVSDGTLSRHEEGLLRRAATLLSLTPEDLAEARQRVTPP
ncbi:MAG: TerB family tellurite resistance protein [Gemmatimonadales bacterium]